MCGGGNINNNNNNSSNNDVPFDIPAGEELTKLSNFA